MPEEIVLTQWQNNARSYFQALYPALYCPTHEEDRLLDTLYGAVQWLSINGCGTRSVKIWSEASFKEVRLFRTKEDPNPDPQRPTLSDPAPLIRALIEFSGTNGKTATDLPAHAPSVLVLADPLEQLRDSSVRRALKETINVIRGTRKTIVIVAQPAPLPEELVREFVVLPFELPSVGELYSEAKFLVEQYEKANSAQQLRKPIQIDAQQVAPFARACSGVSEMEMRSLITLATVKFNAFDGRAVNMALKEKEQIVKRTDVLECRTPNKKLSNVGGLENVKAWVAQNSTILRDAERARAYGLRIPSGLLLTGVPGTGKSLTAQALAGEWRLPFLVCDIGRLMGGLVGESEKNMRKMIEIATAMKPVVLFIDEFEKALGGGSNDGGTTERVKATLLQWLQEKSDEIFVVATANDLRKLSSNPEFLRRFDQIFFVDLPDLRSRIEILGITLRDNGNHVYDPEELVEVCQDLRGYSGAEIAKVAQLALVAAFTEGLEHPTIEQLIAACGRITPLKDTMSEEIARLRQWCREGRAQPAGATLEDDDDAASDHRALETNGFPDLV